MAVKEELRAVAPLAPRLLPLERRTGSQNWIKKKLVPKLENWCCCFWSIVLFSRQRPTGKQKKRWPM